MAGQRFTQAALEEAVAGVHNWSALMRELGMKEGGTPRRRLQEEVAELGLDTSHFTRRSPWRKYTDEAIAAAVAASSSLREVALALDATPASGTMSHLSRHIAKAGLDTNHFPGMARDVLDLPFTAVEVARAAAGASSVRGMARTLGVPDDSRSRAALLRMARANGVDITHFRNYRVTLDEDALREAVAGGSSYADVMRALGLEVDYVNHRRVRRAAVRLKIDTSHFKRSTWNTVKESPRKRIAATALVVMPHGSSRANRTRLHRALQEVGVPYRCAGCGNTGEWLGQTMTLQIDHISGDWLDNRRENLRYLCPNCHALTDTWCQRGKSRRRSVVGEGSQESFPDP